MKKAMRTYLTPVSLLLLLGCSSPQPEATVPASRPLQPSDLPKEKPAPANQDEIPPGSWVEILDIDEKDPFFSQKKQLVGRRCVVRGKALEGDEGLYRGVVRCDYDPDYFFSKVSLGLLREGKIGPQSLPGEVFSEDEVLPGKQVKILGFSYEDQLFPWPAEINTRADTQLRKYGNLIGKTCEVVAEPPLAVMSFLGKAGISVKKPGSAPTSTSAPSPSSGPSSTSAPTSTPAPAQPKPASQEAPKGLVRTGEEWYGGAVLCEKQKVFIYQAWVEVL